MQSIKSPPDNPKIQVKVITLLSLVFIVVIAGLSFAGSGDSLIVRTDGSVEVLRQKDYHFDQIVKPMPPSVVYKVMRQQDVKKEIKNEFQRRFGYKSHAEVKTKWEWADK